MNENLFILANYYYNMGFNISHISPLPADLDNRDIIDLKAPSHEWLQFIIRRQSLEELRSFDWELAIGLGVVLGYNKVRALDIDGCSDDTIVEKMLAKMNLPPDYEWIVRSGSHEGYHILFISEDHNYPTLSDKVKAFRPSIEYVDSFKHIELRYRGHLVLPPSIHYTYNRYEFRSNKFPRYEPKYVPLPSIEILVDEFCQNSDNIDKSRRLSEIEIGDSVFLSYPESLGDGFYLIVDCETTGLPLNWDAPIEDLDNWPRIVQLSWNLVDGSGKICDLIYTFGNHIIKPDGFSIPNSATQIHGISNEVAHEEGKDLNYVLDKFGKCATLASAIVGHNLSFDINVLNAEFLRCRYQSPLSTVREICLMKSTIDFCKIESKGKYKYPKLSELYYKLFDTELKISHDAQLDVDAAAKCLMELLNLGVIQRNQLL